jgi:hypothetical protein
MILTVSSAPLNEGRNNLTFPDVSNVENAEKNHKVQKFVSSRHNISLLKAIRDENQFYFDNEVAWKRDQLSYSQREVYSLQCQRAQWALDHDYPKWDHDTREAIAIAISLLVTFDGDYDIQATPSID